MRVPGPAAAPSDQPTTRIGKRHRQQDHPDGEGTREGELHRMQELLGALLEP